MKQVDYTTWRLGRIVRRWYWYDQAEKVRKMGCTRIIRCPKCGRKGESSGIGSLIKAGPLKGKYSVHVTHAGEQRGLGLFVSDHCSHIQDAP